MIQNDVMVRVSPETKARIEQIARYRREIEQCRVTQKDVVELLVLHEWRKLFWPSEDEAAKEQTNV